jgi:hypothetical protein
MKAIGFIYNILINIKKRRWGESPFVFLNLRWRQFWQGKSSLLLVNGFEILTMIPLAIFKKNRVSSKLQVK